MESALPRVVKSAWTNALSDPLLLTSVRPSSMRPSQYAILPLSPRSCSPHMHGVSPTGSAKQGRKGAGPFHLWVSGQDWCIQSHPLPISYHVGSLLYCGHFPRKGVTATLLQWAREVRFARRQSEPTKTGILSPQAFLHIVVLRPCWATGTRISDFQRPVWLRIVNIATSRNIIAFLSPVAPTEGQ